MSDATADSLLADSVAPTGRRSATRRLFLKLCGAAISAGVAGPVDARLIEPYAVQMTRHEVFLPDLPADCDGLLLAHLTDLHRGAVTPDSVIEQAIRLAVGANPDMVVLTGDFVGSRPADAVVAANMLRALKPRLGLWGCLGNHDYYEDAEAVAAALVEGLNIRLLRNAGEAVLPGLFIAGIEDTQMGRPDPQAALGSLPDNAALLFLTHNPTGVYHVASRSCLALAGHTHGGQVLIPGIPAFIPGGMDGFPMVAGWGRFDRAHLYISRGIGMSGLPLRFRCRPEVALITLRRGDAAPRTQPGLAGRALRRARRAAHRAWNSL